MKNTRLLKNLGKAAFAFSLFIFHFSLANAQLSGTYTINPSSSGSTNFTSFTYAVNALTKNGVSGPVIFNIADGTYKEKVALDSIVGASNINRITFQSASGDSSKVILFYPTVLYNLLYNRYPNNLDSGVISLYHSSYITIKQITITDSFGPLIVIDSPYGNSNSLSEFDNILNCRLIGGKNDTLNPGITGEAININIQNNYLLNSVIGIFSGFNNTLISNNYIDNCQTGIISSNYNFTISYNKIVTSGRGATGINIGFSNGNTQEISHNTIIIPNGSGIQIPYCYASGNGLNIFDNIISVGNIGIYCDRSDFINIEFNNISAENTCIVLYDFEEQTPILSYYNVLDNIMQNPNGGLFVSTSSLLDSGESVNFDYNVYNITGSNTGWFNDDNGNYSTTFQTWQNPSMYGFYDNGRDIHGFELNPDFVSTTDLHATNDSLKGRGFVIPGITDDIDGNPRPNPPTIGANEVPYMAGIQPIQKINTNITLYPNPATSALNIESSNLIQSITIYDATSRVVGVQNLEPNPLNLKVIDVSNLPAGIYIVKLGTDNGTYMAKFMKE